MKKQYFTYVFSALLLLVLNLSGCVTARKYDTLARQNQALEKMRAQCDTTLTSARKQATDLQSQIAKLQDQNRQLIQDSTQLGLNYRRNKAVTDNLFEKYNMLDKSYTSLLANSSTEKGVLSQNLSKKEQELRLMEENILAAKAQNEKLSAELKSREQRVQELEKVLADKDKAVSDLRTRVNNALLSFKGSDLSVDVRNGKVYVSLSEKLLFKSGSYAVDPKGGAAIKKLASVLKEQPDITVTVEGHTDDVPFAKGTGCVNDNWELSALRATSIVKVLVAEGAPAPKLTAAGRSEFVPIAQGKTAEARQRNRRSEIILTPKLDELFKVLEAN
jgi:chemotaxis protein MotB